MSLALAHFAFGALCMTLLLAYLPVRTRYQTALAVASGVWAMVPDFWRVSPIYEYALKEIGHSVVGNVFWLHPLFDRADTADSYRLAAVMVGVYFFVAVIHAERHQDEPILRRIRIGLTSDNGLFGNRSERNVITPVAVFLEQK